MNQDKLEVVKQEVARVNIDILNCKVISLQLNLKIYPIYNYSQKQ